MENKYYVPSIEEFHVGFEFEHDNSREWVKHTLDNSHSLIEVDKDIYINRIKVKYLDKEDIESFGFKVEVLDLGQDTNDEELDITINNVSVGTFFLDKTVHNCNLKLYNSFYNIRNKSEFKRLLQQLNILNDDK